MVTSQDLHRWAIETLMSATVSEVGVRRGVSALYYGVFQRLAREGASGFAIGGQRLQERVACLYDHRVMTEGCRRYLTWSARPSQPPVEFLSGTAPDERLTLLAESFVHLYEARTAADYDLTAVFERAHGLQLMERAETAHGMLDELQGSAELSIFLARLLFGDRLSRRG